MLEVRKTTIMVSKKLRDRLRELKIHPREPYEDVILRLLRKVKIEEGDSGD